MEFHFEPNEEKNVLQKYGQNMNELVKKNKLNKIIGREQEIRRITEILSRKEKNNPILIGEPGVGKTAIVEGFVQKIIAKEVPDNLQNCVVYEINLSSIIAGASFQGQFEKRLNNLINEAKDKAQNIILFIDEIHQLLGLGKNANNTGMDAANILKPMLARGEIKIIGATTASEYRQYIEKDGALERRFQKILVEETTVPECLAILRGLKEKWEIFHKVRILDNAIVAAVKMSERYIPDHYLPDKAIDLIDEAAAKVKTQAISKPAQLETINKQIFYLETEKIALQKEENKTEKTTNRISDIDKELTSLKKQATSIQTEWETQKAEHEKINQLKKTIEQENLRIEQFQNAGDYAQASKLLYSTLPQLKKELQELEQKIDQQTHKLVKDYVSDNDIAEIIARITKIPVDKIFEQEWDKVNNLEPNLLKTIKGQNHAVQLVSQTILKNRVGINNPNRPIGSFLFMGPTGVGKSALAKALAFNLFDSHKAIIQINMSEYMEKHSLSRLIGAPPGYVGYEQAGELSEQVRKKPYSVVLLDEIEKAHPEILNLFLQILDDGYVKDNQGKIVNFKNTIIIMTTNVGGVEILNQETHKLAGLVQKNFKAEFLNRIDEIITFNPITQPIASAIAQEMLEQLQMRLQEHEYYIDFHPSVLQFVVQNGFNQAFGARPLNRFIQKTVENFIAQNIVNNMIQKQTKLTIWCENNELQIKMMN